jgi:hypothetical protein
VVADQAVLDLADASVGADAAAMAALDAGVGPAGAAYDDLSGGPPVPSPGLSGSQLDHITGIGASFDSDGDLTEDGKTYAAVYKGLPRPAWVREPWLSPSQIDPANGYHGIGFELDATGTPLAPTDGMNDKANLTLEAFATGVDIWEGFDLELTKFAQPNVSLILAQWWQGSPYGPPVSLVEKADGAFACDVLIRNDQTGGNPGAPTLDLPLGTCSGDGSWHAFLFHIRAGFAGDGIVEVWKDKMVGPPLASYAGNVGYDPSACVYVNGQASQGCQGGNANAELTAFYGPYRPLDTVREQLFFANLKFAYDRASADPTAP